MIRNLFLSITSCCFLALTGCNDKPEVKPVDKNILVVYPNPSIEIAAIRVNSPQVFSLKVIDTKGEVVMSETGTSHQDFKFALNGKAEGTYHVVLEAGKQTYVQKLVLISK